MGAHIHSNTSPLPPTPFSACKALVRRMSLLASKHKSVWLLPDAWTRAAAAATGQLGVHLKVNAAATPVPAAVTPLRLPALRCAQGWARVTCFSTCRFSTLPFAFHGSRSVFSSRPCRPLASCHSASQTAQQPLPWPCPNTSAKPCAFPTRALVHTPRLLLC